MKVSASKLRRLALYYMLIYILNKALFDFLIPQIAGYVYYLIVFIGFVLCLVKNVSKKEFRGIVLCYAIYSLYIVFNGLYLSNTDQQGVGFIKYITYPMVFFATYYCMKSMKNTSDIIKFIQYWGIISSVLALYEYVFATAILPNSTAIIYRYYDGSSAFRARVFCGSPMGFAVLLSTVFVMFLSEYNMTHKARYLVEALIVLVGVFATGSRAPLLSAMIGVAVMYLYMYRNGKVPKKTFSTILVFIIGFFVFLIAMIIIGPGNGFIGRIYSRFSSVLDLNEWGNNERLVRWAYYLGQFWNNSIMGIGIAKTNAEVASNSLQVISNGITTESGVLAHLVETGIVGTYLYYLFVYKVLKNKLRREVIKRHVFLVAFFVLFFVEDFVLQISMDIFDTFLFWLLAAYAYKLYDNYKTNELNGVKK